MSDTLSYADAVRLLGGEKSRFVDWFDKLTSAVPVPPLLGILDARGFVRLGHELVRTVSEQRSGLSRHGRTQRLQAAHAVIAVTAFYEALAQVDLPFTPADLALDKGEQLALAGAGPVTGTTVTEAFFRTAAPVPGAHLPYPDLSAALGRYYDDLATFGIEGDPAERAVAAFVLERMAVDEGLAPGFVADALRLLAELSLTEESRAPAFRCLLAFLGRDDQADLRFVAFAADLVLAARGFAAGRGRPADWLDEAGADVLVRLHELELRREPVSAAEAESFRQRCGRRRPDLVERLRPLADADWVG